MALSSRDKAIIAASLSSAAALFLVLSIVVGVRDCGRRADKLDTELSVDAIASRVAYEAKGAGKMTEARARDLIRLLIKARDVAGVVTDAGPTDVFGAPFRCRCEIEADRASATCTSAGPDCVWGTEDDIESTKTWPP